MVHDTTTKSHAKDTTKAVVTEATEEYTNVPDEYEYDDVTVEDNTTEENTTEENTTQVITEVWHEDEDVITNFDPCVYNECENEAVCTGRSTICVKLPQFNVFEVFGECFSAEKLVFLPKIPLKQLQK